MNRTRQLLLPFSGVGLLIVSAVLLRLGFVADAQASLSPPYLGSTVVDLGNVETIDGHGGVTHTFELTNNSGEPLTIDNLSKSCLCIDAECSDEEWSPGEMLHVEVTLNLPDFGHRTAEVRLMLSNGDVVPLVLSATGRLPLRLVTPQQRLTLGEDGAIDIPISALTLESGPPPTIIVNAAIAVEYTFTPWEIVHEGRRADGRPARWKTQLTVNATERIASSFDIHLRQQAAGPRNQDLTLHLEWPEGAESGR